MASGKFRGKADYIASRIVTNQIFAKPYHPYFIIDETGMISFATHQLYFKLPTQFR